MGAEDTDTAGRHVKSSGFKTILPGFEKEASRAKRK